MSITPERNAHIERFVSQYGTLSDWEYVENVGMIQVYDILHMGAYRLFRCDTSRELRLGQSCKQWYYNVADEWCPLESVEHLHNAIKKHCGGREVTAQDEAQSFNYLAEIKTLQGALSEVTKERDTLRAEREQVMQDYLAEINKLTQQKNNLLSQVLDSPEAQAREVEGKQVVDDVVVEDLDEEPMDTHTIAQRIDEQFNDYDSVTPEQLWERMMSLPLQEFAIWLRSVGFTDEEFVRDGVITPELIKVDCLGMFYPEYSEPVTLDDETPAPVETAPTSAAVVSDDVIEGMTEYLKESTNPSDFIERFDKYTVEKQITWLESIGFERHEFPLNNVGGLQLRGIKDELLELLGVPSTPAPLKQRELVTNVIVDRPKVTTYTKKGDDITPEFVSCTGLEEVVRARLPKADDSDIADIMHDLYVLIPEGATFECGINALDTICAKFDIDFDCYVDIWGQE